MTEKEKGKEQAGEISRREFLKDAGFVVAGAAIGAGITYPLTSGGKEPWLPDKWDYEADVVVCGYGTAGMPAAIEAHDAGAEVLIIEKLAEPGGSCRRCGGGIVGANTIVQRALGIVDDTPNKLYEYMVACGEGYTDPALARVFADNAGKNVDWIIEDLGGQPVSEWSFAKNPEEPGTGPGLNFSATPTWYEEFGKEPVMRCHWFTAVGEPWWGGMGGGTALFKAFDDAVKARGIETMVGTCLVGLVATSDREVLGIKALSGGKTLYIKAKKGVIITTGGFHKNEKMVREYIPSWVGKESIVHPDHAHGEGIIAGMGIGADLCNMGVLRWEPGGGLRINAKAQVMDVYGDVIHRLYAGGVVSAGVIGCKYPSCGTHVSVAVCFGRIGGKNAGDLEPWD